MSIALIIFTAVLVIANVYFVFGPMIQGRKTDKYVS